MPECKARDFMKNEAYICVRRNIEMSATQQTGVLGRPEQTARPHRVLDNMAPTGYRKKHPKKRNFSFSACTAFGGGSSNLRRH